MVSVSPPPSIHKVWREVYLRAACCTVWQNDLQVVIAMETAPGSYPLPLCCSRTSPKTIHYTSFLFCKLHLKLCPSSAVWSAYRESPFPSKRQRWFHNLKNPMLWLAYGISLRLNANEAILLVKTTICAVIIVLGDKRWCIATFSG